MVILFSGGVDSAAVAWEARHGIESPVRDEPVVGTVGRWGGAIVRPLLFFVDFGQPARAQERDAARACAAFLKLELIEHSTILPGVGAMFAASTGRVFDGTGPRVMAGRNLALLSLAVSLAASRGLTRVQFGAIADDARDYPDCRVEFVQALRATAEVAYGVRVDAPFLHLRKAEVMARLPSGLLALTWSCYEPRDARPCGTCDSCRLRDTA